VAAIGGSANGVTVKNGVLGPFYQGISLDGSNNVIKDNFIIAANHPMQINGDGNVIAGNRSSGSDGMFARGNRNVFVENSVSSGHSGLGARGDGNLIERNSVSGDGGIFAIGLQNRILRNVAGGAVGSAIAAAGPEVVIERNVVFRGHVGVISVRQSDRARIERNVVSIAAEVGIQVEASSQAVVARNVVSHTTEWGIRVITSSEAVVERNQVSEASNEGGIFAGPSIVVTKNVASFNDGLGIYGEPGVIDGGGNRAFGNSDPQQCVNVVCK
jgi:parallel beta-helix repeat protein